jgi:hypothetical protein
MKITRALSIRQPFAEQIFRGDKITEYRTVPTNIRERVYIYASQKFDVDSALYDYMDVIEKLPRGTIVGTVEIVGCEYDEDYSQYEWKLAKPKRLKKLLKPKNKPQPVWFKPF